MTKFEFCENDGKVRASLQIPSEWDEMTAEQVRFVFRAFEEYAVGRIDAIQLKVRILMHLAGNLPQRFRKRDSAIGENLYRMCEKLDFLFKIKEDGGLMGLSFQSVQNPLPVVRSGKARALLTGPASALTDLTFGEFRHASAALNAFFGSSDMADLDECIAFLYRRRSIRANRAGRKVKPVDYADMSSAISAASGIEPWAKTLIMMWFASCINYLQTGTVRLNGEEVDLALLFSGSGKGASGPAFTWNDLLVQIAKDQTIGNMDRVDEEPLYSIIAIMWSNYKENKRYEKASKSS